MRRNAGKGLELQKPLVDHLLRLMTEQDDNGIKQYCNQIGYEASPLYKASRGKQSPRLSTILELLDDMGYTLVIGVK